MLECEMPKLMRPLVFVHLNLVLLELIFKMNNNPYKYTVSACKKKYSVFFFSFGFLTIVCLNELN